MLEAEANRIGTSSRGAILAALNRPPCRPLSRRKRGRSSFKSEARRAFDGDHCPLQRFLLIRIKPLRRPAVLEETRMIFVLGPLPLPP